MIISMMKHSFENDKQRSKIRLNLSHVLSGSRDRFKAADKHELNCR